MFGPLAGPWRAPGVAGWDQICSANHQKMWWALKSVTLPPKYMKVNRY